MGRHTIDPLRSCAAAIALLVLHACGDGPTTPVGCVPTGVVYGSDDREESTLIAAPWRALAEQVVALVPAAVFSEVSADPAAAERYAATARHGLCADEPFASQPSLAVCSAVLVSRDLVLTASHCIEGDACDAYEYVRGFQSSDADAGSSPVFGEARRCARVEARDAYAEVDLALIRLASPFASTPALPAIRRDRPAIGESLRMLGFPSGLPLKMHTGMVVSRESMDALAFGTDLDSFSGDSGAPVFDEWGALAGLMQEGQLDYVFDATTGCFRRNVASVDVEAGAFERAIAVGPVLERSCARGEQLACGILAHAPQGRHLCGR